MSITHRILEFIGRDANSAPDAYRCIRCGTAFDRQYRECPECGVPYAISEKRTDE